jgi:hypothetical protein
LKYFIGIEAMLLDQFAARAGLNDGSLTLGGGYLFQLFSRSVQIQYAFVTKKYDAASEHIFSWVFHL